MKKDVKLEWYVLNDVRFPNYDKRFSGYPYSTGCIKPFNIFDCISVYEATIDLCNKYKAKHMTFDEFVEELRKIIQWKEWSRCEYEIMVGSLFETVPERFQKIDCYQQVLPNIRILARYVLETYYPRIKL